MTEPTGNPVGRPTVITPETIAKLEEGFSRGLNKLQACLYAGISYASLNRHEKEDPDFDSRCALLRENVGMHAVLNIADKITIEKDPDKSEWYLENKISAEYNKRNTTVLTGPGADGKILIEVTGVESGSEAAKVGNAEFIPFTTL